MSGNHHSGGGGHHDHPGIDAYAGLKSPIHSWDARFKLIGFLLIIVAFALVQNLWLLIPMYMITDLLLAFSGIPRRFVRTRLLVPGLFILSVVILLPFVSGETILASFGPVDIRREGLVLAVLGIVRFWCIITLSILIFGTDTFTTIIKAMRALRFPELLSDMVLLTYRYIFEIGEQFAQLRVAAQLRGFSMTTFSLDGLRTVASLIGHMLVRSYEQSEHVYKAMILRGYGAGTIGRNDFQATSRDTVKLVAAVLVAAAFIAAQLILGTTA